MKLTYGKFFGLRHNVFAFPIGYVQFGPTCWDVRNWLGICRILCSTSSTFCAIFGRDVGTNVGAYGNPILGLILRFAKI